MADAGGARNPALLVAAGESALLPLGRDVQAFVARGTRPGPIVWAWVPRGEGDPSMAQALGELRDRLSPQRMNGAVGLLIDGPPPPYGNEASPWASLLRSLCHDADALVLLVSMPVGCESAPHAELDLSSTAARKIARALGARFAAPEVLTAPLNRAIVTAPAVTWVDGESERLSRAVINRAADALGSLLGTLGVTDDVVARPDVRVVVKSVATVDAGFELRGGGLVEPVVSPGDLVHKGQAVAYAGQAGARRRRTLRAPANGVVLYARSGQVVGGDVMGIAKLRRALPAVERVRKRDGIQVFDVGYCERVSLPELGVRLRAKIDTGARSSALHVGSLREVGFDDDGHVLLDVAIPDGLGDGREKARLTRVAVVEYTHVTDSGGHTERRPVIETLLQIGERRERVRVTLTDRGERRFPMLIGRTGLGGNVRVHPQRRYLLGKW
jgi:hypothetical protein